MTVFSTKTNSTDTVYKVKGGNENLVIIPHHEPQETIVHRDKIDVYIVGGGSGGGSKDVFPIPSQIIDDLFRG